MTKVSVCMITYNHEAFITEALEGVFNQQCDFDIEVIISNDCSTDQTHKTITEFLKTNTRRNITVNYFNHTKNLGMIPNFKFTLKQCKGTYIALCDGDDYWTDPLKLQKQVDFLEANEEYNICFHKVQMLEGAAFVEDVIEKRFDAIANRPISRQDLLEQGNFMHTPSVVFRRQSLDLPFEFYTSTIGDYFLHIINASNGYIHRIDEFMAVYRKGVGVYSTLSSAKMTLKILSYQSSLLSYLSEPSEKKILLEKQMQLISSLEGKMSELDKKQYLTINTPLSYLVGVILLKLKRKFRL